MGQCQGFAGGIAVLFVGTGIAVVVVVVVVDVVAVAVAVVVVAETDAHLLGTPGLVGVAPSLRTCLRSIVPAVV